MMGECTKEQAFELLDTYYDLGGNFIDTANMYQLGQSEQWIGDWLQKTGRRNEMVISTKYTMSPMAGKPVQQSNFGGTGTKSMHMAIELSLKNLQTDYIDLVRAAAGRVPHSQANDNIVLCPCLGLCHLHPGTDAVPQHPGAAGEGPVSGNQ